MREQDHKVGARSVLDYRRAAAVRRDPLLRMTTFLIAFGLVSSLLVLADTVRYARLPAPAEIAPVTVDLVQAEVELDIKDREDEEPRGDQQIDPKEQEDKIESKKEEEPLDDPPAPVTNKEEKPVGPAQTDNSDDKAPAISVTGGGGRPRALFSNRGGKAKQSALGKYGGGPRTENAVRLGLSWLARHQEADGSWSRTDFHKHCRAGGAGAGGAECDGAGISPVPLDPAITGLSLLCFLASDNTNMKGPFKANAARAAKYLCKIQTKGGGFGKYTRPMNQYMMYNQGIATFALAELYAMSRDPALRPHVEKAVQFITRAQQPSGAWDYRDIRTGRYDTSVTGWQVMALKSAEAAGVAIPSYTLYKLARFIDSVTLPTGHVIYANAFPGPGRKGQGMVAVGLASAQFLGFSTKTRAARRQTSIILSHLPDWGKLRRTNPFDSIYYWYYATIGMFQTGGDPWKRWNRQMKKTLLLHQRRGGCADGSWDAPNNFWGQIGGRFYATTLSILSLEIYYRYLPLYAGGTLKTVDALIDTVKRGERADVVSAVRLLAKFDDRKARGFLVEVANSDDHQLALEASVVLAARKDAAAIVPLLRELRSPNQYVRYRALGGLKPMIGRGLADVFIKCLRDEKAIVARQAARALRQYANVSFGFEPEAGSRERDAAIKKWEQWWKDRQKGIVTAKSSVPWLVVSVRPTKGLVAFNTGGPGLTQSGKRYSVYRNDRFIARINVVAVEGEICVGKTIGQYTAAEIKEGDVVKPGT